MLARTGPEPRFELPAEDRQLLGADEGSDGARAAAGVPSAVAEPAPSVAASSLTLFQANLLVGMLGGFWARRADGHPGPDIMSRGMLKLRAIVEWERTKQELAKQQRPGKERRRQRKPG